MPYQLTEILKKAGHDDADLIIGVLDSYVNFSDDRGLKKLNAGWKKDGGAIPLELNYKLEKEIRYSGSSDIAYFFRKIFSKSSPPGADMDVIIEDVFKSSRIKYKEISTTEGKLEYLAFKAVEKRILEIKNPKEQIAFLEKYMANKGILGAIHDHIGKNPCLALPLVYRSIGSREFIKLIQSLGYGLIAAFVSKKILSSVLAGIGKRLPWLSAPVVGQILGSAGAIWTAADLSGPAFRKTFPILIHLGVVCLRERDDERELPDELLE